MQDAIIMNKGSLDRGFGRCIVHHTYKATLKKYSNRAADRVMAPVPKARIGTYHLLESDGLSAVGRVINPGAPSPPTQPLHHHPDPRRPLHPHEQARSHGELAAPRGTSGGA